MVFLSLADTRGEGAEGRGRMEQNEQTKASGQANPSGQVSPGEAKEPKRSLLYRAVRGLVRLFYPKIKVYGAENLPQEPCIVVGNHSKMNGPIGCELYFPGRFAIWCVEQMMVLKEVPAYAFQDFWSMKPKYIRWFYKLASYVIAPLSVCVFNNADTIPVYRDTRTITTFRRTVEALQDGLNVIIFPECPEEHNHIVYKFQTKFTDVAKLYYRRAEKAVQFVPLYIAPRLKSMYIGKPIQFDPNVPIAEERERICDYLMDEITRMAESLPEHIVIPYKNIPKKMYNTNKARTEGA